MKISDAYMLTLHGIDIDEVPISVHETQIIKTFKRYEHLTDVEEIYRLSKIPKWYIRAFLKEKNGSEWRGKGKVKYQRIPCERYVKFGYYNNNIIINEYGFSYQISIEKIQTLAKLTYSEIFREAGKIVPNARIRNSLWVFISAYKEGRVTISHGVGE
ncbi:MAG: hypothetical protein PHW84_02065 [Methanosarcina sp.]|nr:hypothetical protein [Methanosarcina sp.]